MRHESCMLTHKFFFINYLSHCKVLGIIQVCSPFDSLHINPQNNYSLNWNWNYWKCFKWVIHSEYYLLFSFLIYFLLFVDKKVPKYELCCELYRIDCNLFRIKWEKLQLIVFTEDIISKNIMKCILGIASQMCRHWLTKWFTEW